MIRSGATQAQHTLHTHTTREVRKTREGGGGVPRRFNTKNSTPTHPEAPISLFLLPAELPMVMAVAPKGDGLRLHRQSPQRRLEVFVHANEGSMGGPLCKCWNQVSEGASGVLKDC